MRVSNGCLCDQLTSQTPAGSTVCDYCGAVDDRRRTRRLGLASFLLGAAATTLMVLLFTGRVHAFLDDLDTAWISRRAVFALYLFVPLGLVIPAYFLGRMSGLLTSGREFWLAGLLMVAAFLAMGGFFQLTRDRVVESAGCAMNLNTIALALAHYESIHGCYPPRVVRDPNGKPLLSWRVLILPELLGDDELFRKFRLDEAWDSPHNRALLRQMPGPYVCGESLGWSGKTPFQVLDGAGTFLGNEPTLFRSFTDDRSTTLAIVEAEHAVPWTSPEDVPWAPDQPARIWNTQHYRPGFRAVAADGGPLFVKPTVPTSLVKAMGTRAGGEAVDLRPY